MAPACAWCIALTHVLCLQASTTADSSSLPHHHSSQQQTGAAQGQVAPVPSWAPPSSANAAAPSGAELPSHRQPPTNRPSALSHTDHAPTLHGRPGAPYLSRTSVHQPPRHTQHSGSTAADAIADVRRVAQQPRHGVHSSRRQVADGASAAESQAGDGLLNSQRTAPRCKAVSRLQDPATGVIDLTIDGHSASPSLSTSSDCIVLGATRCTQDPPSVGYSLNSELTDPSYGADEPPRYSVSSTAVSSAEVGAADGANATEQLAGGDPEVSPAARLGGSGQGAPTAPAARLLALPTDAQAACTHQRRRRRDVMPEDLSPGTATALNPSSSEALGNIPANSFGFGEAQSIRSKMSELSGIKALPPEADRQQQHMGCSQLVTADSRQDVGEAASQQQRQDGCTSTVRRRQSKKRPRTRSPHSRHRSCSSRSREHHKRSRRQHHGRSDAGLAVDRQCVDGSSTRYYQTHDQHMPCTSDSGHSQCHPRVSSQHNSYSGPTAIGRMHASQDDRWQMWHPQGV